MTDNQPLSVVEYNETASRLGAPLLSRGVVVLLHGMYTPAHWHGEVTPVLNLAGFTVVPVYFGFLTWEVFHLWTESTLERIVTVDLDRKLHAFRREIAAYGFALVGHSFGTLVIRWALESSAEIRPKAVILVGSIIRRDFDWARICARNGILGIRHERSQRDRWVWIAPCFIRNAGRSGVRGFLRPCSQLTEVNRDVNTHGILTAGFCDREWVPYLSSIFRVI